MNKKALEILREVINTWKGKRMYTFEHKQVFEVKSPIAKGELVLRFRNSLKNFYCNGNPIVVELNSRPFHTGTLSDDALSQNIEGDKHRLFKLLEEFDELFYAEVERKLNECFDSLTTSDPLFFP